MLKQIAHQMEKMAEQMEQMTVAEVMQLPNFQFMNDLKKALINAGISESDAEYIVMHGDFSLNYYNESDPSIKSIISSFVRVSLVAKNKLAPTLFHHTSWCQLVKLSLKMES